MPALALPGSGPTTSTFPMTCDGVVLTFSVGGGPWSAAHLAETGETFVPVATHLYLSDAGSLAPLYEEHDFKGTPRAGDASCVDEFTMDGLLVTSVVEGRIR